MDAAVGKKPSLTLERRLNAAPSLVYGALTEPAQLARWFGPGTTTVVNAHLDVREGGRYSVILKTEDGEAHNVGGEYRIVRPNEQLTFTWAWISTPERVSLVTITLKPDGEGTLLTLLHEQFFDDAARDRHADGWSGSLDRLEALLG